MIINFLRRTEMITIKFYYPAGLKSLMIKKDNKIVFDQCVEDWTDDEIQELIESYKENK